MIAVRGLGYWSEGYADLASLRAGVRDPAVVQPPERFAAAARRRTTLLSRMAAEVLAQTGADLGSAALVFVSVGGELEQTFANLELLDASPPSSSPLRFGNSVHNAALGHLSIPYGNRSFGSAIAAAPALAVAMGLLEGVGWVAAHGGDVVVVWAEERWPESAAPPEAAAVWLSAEGADRLGVPTQTGGPAIAAPVTHVLRALAEPGVIALGGGWTAAWRPGTGSAG